MMEEYPAPPRQQSCRRLASLQDTYRSLHIFRDMRSVPHFYWALLPSCQSHSVPYPQRCALQMGTSPAIGNGWPQVCSSNIIRPPCNWLFIPQASHPHSRLIQYRYWLHTLSNWTRWQTVPKSLQLHHMEWMGIPLLSGKDWTLWGGGCVGTTMFPGLHSSRHPTGTIQASK